MIPETDPTSGDGVYDPETGVRYGRVDKPRIEAAVREFLAAIGEDPDREGLVGTPDRVARACEELFSGMHEDPAAHLRKQFHEERADDMVIVRDIPFSSLCEHHILPFVGKAHVAYIPNGYITGLSKIARVVDIFSHRLQVQERFTLQIKQSLQEALQPKGVMVVVEAQHMCMQMRGVEKDYSVTTTTDFCGAFEQTELREEFLRHIGRK